MALAVRARLLLFAASPLCNGNKDYEGHVNSDGEALFNTVYSEEKWKKAADASKLLIDEAEANGYGIYKVFNDDGSVDAFSSYQGMLFERANKEILFPYPGCDVNNFNWTCTPVGGGGAGGYGVTQSLVDAFFMKNGLPAILGYNSDGSPIINEVSGYTEEGFTTEDDIRDTKWDEFEGVEPDIKIGRITYAGTYNMYANREPRFYCSVGYNGMWHLGLKRKINLLNGGLDGMPNEIPQSGYIRKKGSHPGVNPQLNIWPYHTSFLYRLGEFYLNYAEALNEYDPGNPDILKYLNLIRERAGIPQYGNASDEIPVSADPSEIRKLIHMERRVELNCENAIRYHDLRRWKEAVDVLNTNFYGMDITGADNNSFYKRRVYQTRVYRKEFLWYPVPQSEIDRNLNIVQAPFWNKQ